MDKYLIFVFNTTFLLTINKKILDFFDKITHILFYFLCTNLTLSQVAITTIYSRLSYFQSTMNKINTLLKIPLNTLNQLVLILRLLG